MLEEHDHKHAVHNFDGIIENRVTTPPRYFTILFYGLILWGTAFCAFYLLSGWSSQGEFEQKMADHQQQVAEQRAVPPTGTSEAGIQTAPQVDAAALFAQNCAVCHGADGKGGIGPDLTTPQYKYGKNRHEISESIAQGRPEGMPPFGSQLKQDEVAALADYLLSLP